MIKKLEHIGIAISHLEQAEEIFKDLFEQDFYKQELVESEGVLTSFMKIGDIKIELLKATNSQSSIAKYLEKNGNGIHHLAFECDNLEAELERLEKKGFQLIHKTPKKGADNKMIAFLHPKSTSKVLIELCEEAQAL